MKNLILSSALVLIASPAAQAQQAVQWRVQDGGNGHWYQLRAAPLQSWADCAIQAQESGGSLATLATPGENGFVVAAFAGSSTRYPWIGLSQAPDAVEPIAGWSWVTGEPLSWSNWSPSEPNGDGAFDADQANLWLVEEPGRPRGTWNDWHTGGPDGFLIEWSADCNSDGVVDYGQILAGDVADTNTNGIPDCCEQGIPCLDPDGDGIAGTSDNCPDVANPDQRDCNGNGIGEACESFTDCNRTLLPDSCDIAAGTSADADANGVPDECQPDCNMNDLPDAFEIATGLVSDLNNDIIPDDCQGARMVRLESANLGAPSGEVARVWTADELLLSETSVTITVDLRGDLNGQSEWVDVVLNDSAPRRFFEADGNLCPATPDRATITLPRAEFNDLIGDGRLLTVRVQCPPTVDATDCKNDGLTIVSLSYVGIEPKGDCNGNERLDVVEVVDGTTPDCNTNNVPDSCDIARGAESDCNLNGIPDSCEVASDPATDCNGNLRPDTCDVASGTSADRDGNLRPDECQTVTVPGDFATIQQAIDTAPTSDMRIIAVAAGIHDGPLDFRGKPIVVRGAGAGTTVIQGSAGQQSSVVRFMSGEPAVSALERVTVKGGATGTPLPNFPSALAGGGILGIDAATSIRECVIESNGAGFGGGAYLLRCSGEVRQCTFRNNTASTDGGGLQMNLSTGSVIDCVIEQNSANSRGGGLHLVQGTPTLVRVSVNGNVSSNLMGGLSWFSVGSPQALLAFDDCVVTNNTALVSLGGVGITDSGGAVASMTISGSTICSNTPRPNIGGGRWSNLGDNSICDCTADLTLDGIVDGVDLAALLSQWGSSGGGFYPADIDGSGVVDGGDLGIVLGGWGPCPQ